MLSMFDRALYPWAIYDTERCPMPGYSYFALSVICLLTIYIPLFWALGEFKDTSRNMKRFFIGFMPIGLACVAWIELCGLDWTRVLSNLAYAAFGSLILALIHKFSQP